MQQKATDLNKLFKTLILDMDASVMETEQMLADEIKILIREQQIITKNYY